MALYNKSVLYLRRIIFMDRRVFMKAGIIGLGAMAIADKATALQYYPKKSDKKWAVIFSTWCGSSRDAGVWISEGLGGIADVFDVRENPDPKGYDHIVVGGSIRMGKVSQEMQDYLVKNKDVLKNKISGFFCVCGNGKQPTGPEQVKMLVDNHLSVITGVSGVPAKVFNGRITLSLVEPEYVEMLKRYGEYDLMKRTDFLDFGKTILAAVK
jgi:menaquinone-dependent protoporphyrinogen IX oxidase